MVSGAIVLLAAAPDDLANKQTLLPPERQETGVSIRPRGAPCH